jgi:hypothetical protein
MVVGVIHVALERLLLEPACQTLVHAMQVDKIRAVSGHLWQTYAAAAAATCFMYQHADGKHLQWALLTLFLMEKLMKLVSTKTW